MTYKSHQNKPDKSPCGMDREELTILLLELRGKYIEAYRHRGEPFYEGYIRALRDFLIYLGKEELIERFEIEARAEA